MFLQLLGCCTWISFIDKKNAFKVASPFSFDSVGYSKAGSFFKNSTKIMKNILP